MTIDRGPIQISPAQQAEMCELYQRGKTMREVAQSTFWSQTTVHRVLHFHGVPIRPTSACWHTRRKTEHDTNAFLRTAELYGKGYSVRQVAAMVDRSPATVIYRLRRYGVQLRPRGNNTSRRNA